MVCDSIHRYGSPVWWHPPIEIRQFLDFSGTSRGGYHSPPFPRETDVAGRVADRVAVRRPYVQGVDHHTERFGRFGVVMGRVPTQRFVTWAVRVRVFPPHPRTQTGTGQHVDVRPDPTCEGFRHHPRGRELWRLTS